MSSYRSPLVRILLASACGVASFSFVAKSSGQEADIAVLRARAQANAGDADASFALGKALRRAGRAKEAVVELGRGALMPSAQRNGLAVAMRYELARAKIDQRDFLGALGACNGLGPSARALGAACRAEAHLLQNRAAEALPEVEKALAIDAHLYEAKVAEGRARALQGGFAEADAAFAAAIALADRRPEAHHHLGLLLQNQGKRDAAVAELKKAMNADPADPEIAYALAGALGRNAEGRDALQKAVQIRPTFAAAHAELGLTALDLGDSTTAEKEALQALALDARSFAAHVALGRVHVEQQKWDEALKEGETAKRLIPNSAAGDLLLADAQAGKGDIDLAVESYQRAFGLNRMDPTPLVRAARACIAASRLTTAKGFAEKVTSDFPKWGPGWVELGNASIRLNDRLRARAAFETALRCDGPVDRDKVQKALASL